MILVPVESDVVAERSLYLGASPNRQPHTALRQWMDWLPADTPAFGEQNPVWQFQLQLAELFGKEAALILPTGKMAQQIALRIAADRSGLRTFAAHPSTHLVHWELDGYSLVHDLAFAPLGAADRLFERADIEALTTPVGTVLWELPQREIGGVLPTRQALSEQIATARATGARVHLDGARVWEAQTFYQVPLAEIATEFDSVYVSLYKSLEVPRGAVLLGDQDFIDEAYRWAVRLGGESAGNWPLAVAGMYAVGNVLPRLASYRERALEIAAALGEIGVATRPSPPQTPFFLVELPVGAEAAAAAHRELSAETDLELCRFFRPGTTPDRCGFEISVSAAADTISTAEITGFVTRLIARADSSSPLGTSLTKDHQR
jgi:threonine aldolase